MRRDEIRFAPPPSNDRPSGHWQCGRLCGGQGIGNCPLGPRPGGVCGSATDRCDPALTSRGVRRRVVIGVSILGVVGLVVMTLIAPRSFYKPGPLSRPHALILSGQAETSHCSACHAPATSSLASWFSSGGEGHAGVSQTDRCMDCHHVSLSRELARSPHNLSSVRLAEIRESWGNDDSGRWADAKDVAKARGAAVKGTAVKGTAVKGTAVKGVGFSTESQSRLECSACHREHGGADANLSLLTNAQCQSCHSRSFQSFAVGHPDWNDWPYVRQATIAFDHATHERLHYPKASAETALRDGGEPGATSASGMGAASGIGRVFDCAVCHPRSGATPGGNTAGWSAAALAGDGEPVRTVGYEIACADCHDGGLKERAGQRLDLFVLPGLGNDAAALVGGWPSAATGFYDGEIGPLARWILRGNVDAQTAIGRLPADGSVTRVDPGNRDHTDAAAVLAREIRATIDDFAVRGGTAVAERTDPQSAAAMRRLLRGLSPQWVWDARARWFAAPPERIGRRRPMADDGVAADVVPLLSLFGDRVERGVLRVSAIDDLLGEDLLSGEDLLGEDLLGELPQTDSGESDPLLGVPLPGEDASAAKGDSSGESRFDPVVMLPDGGWYRDDLRMSISYRGGGHADPVLRSAIELAAGLPADDPVRTGLLAGGPAASCIECHPGALADNVPKGTGPVWTSPAVRPASRSLTRFSHKPHFNLPQLSDCRHCHRVNEAASMGDGRVSGGADGMLSCGHGLGPLGKDACVGCHQPGAAGDACTQCHHYHVHR